MFDHAILLAADKVSDVKVTFYKIDGDKEKKERNHNKLHVDDTSLDGKVRRIA